MNSEVNIFADADIYTDHVICMAVKNAGQYIVYAKGKLKELMPELYADEPVLGEHEAYIYVKYSPQKCFTTGTIEKDDSGKYELWEDIEMSISDLVRAIELDFKDKIVIQPFAINRSEVKE